MTFHLGWQRRELRDSTPADTLLGDTPGPTEGPRLFSQNPGKKSLQIRSDAKEQEAAGGKVSQLKERRACKQLQPPPPRQLRSMQTNTGTKSKLALCVCSDVKFCCILVPLPPLAASVSRRIRLQSRSARGVFVHRCHSQRSLL